MFALPTQEALVSSPSVLESQLTAVKNMLTGYDAMRFDPTKDNLFSMRDEVAHTKLRGKMTAGVRSASFSLDQRQDKTHATD